MNNELGGLFMVGLPGLELDESTRRLISEYGVCNFIIFRRNVQEPGQLRRLCRELALSCRASGLPPPLVSVDQEGGSVARLKAPHFTEFPDARIMAGSAEAEDGLREFGQTCARELLAAGINMNLAPVLDVCPAGGGLVMERRSLGAEADRVARLGALVITAMQDLGLAACAKHFPGLGQVSLDPHLARPTVERSLAELASCDLIPFRAAISAGVAAVMTSHTIYPELDPDNPATLSSLILDGLLRKELGYDGLVVTDDLEMGAIENEGTVAEAALAAMMAGADLLLICHEHAKVIAAIEVLCREAGNRLSRERLAKSLGRIAGVRRRFAASGD